MTEARRSFEISIKDAKELLIRFDKKNSANIESEWASPEHQIRLFEYFDLGSDERAKARLASSVSTFKSTLRATKRLIYSIDSSREMEVQNVEWGHKGVRAYVSGGMSGWMEPQQ